MCFKCVFLQVHEPAGHVSWWGGRGAGLHGLGVGRREQSCDQELQEEKSHPVCCGCPGNQLLPVVLVWRSVGVSLWHHIPHALWVPVLDLLDSHLPYYRCTLSFSLYTDTGVDAASPPKHTQYLGTNAIVEILSPTHLWIKASEGDLHRDAIELFSVWKLYPFTRKSLLCSGKLQWLLTFSHWTINTSKEALLLSVQDHFIVQTKVLEVTWRKWKY